METTYRPLTDGLAMGLVTPLTPDDIIALAASPINPGHIHRSALRAMRLARSAWRRIREPDDATFMIGRRQRSAAELQAENARSHQRPGRPKGAISY